MRSPSFTQLVVVISLLFSGTLFARYSLFYTEIYFTSGAYNGLPMDTDHNRSFVELKRTEFTDQLEDRVGYFRIGNIYHNGKHFVGYVPRYSFKSLHFVFEKFHPIAGHAELLYSFSSPVVLTHEVLDNGLLKKVTPIKLNDLIFSAEAVGPKGKTFDFFADGKAGNLGMSFRLTSVPGRLKDKILIEKRPTHMFNLQMTREEIRKSFINMIDIYNNRGMNQMYNLYSNNCFHAAFNVLGIARSTRSQFALMAYEKYFNALLADFSDDGYINSSQQLLKDFLGDAEQATGWDLQPLDVSQAEVFSQWLTQSEKQILSSRRCFRLFESANLSPIL